MNNSAGPYWLTLAVLLAALYGGFKWHQVQKSRPVGGLEEISLPPLEEFELTERSGEPFRSRDMKGRVWVVTFFFASCPGSCSRLNANIKYLSNLPEIQDVTWVSITVDPERDTLEALRRYADDHNADPKRWLFCRGDFPYIKRIAHDMLRVGGVSYQGHNDYAVIIDRDGEIAGMFNATSLEQTARGVETLKKLLAAPHNPESNSVRAGSSSTPAGPQAKAA
jgi:cytochrome oxidase Cu insertion factor (SCO1/SenC/PrrC family)